MAISDEITRLQQAKADLKTAIESKGVTVPNSTKLDGYADLVDSIEAGGGDETVVLDLRNFQAGGTFNVNLDDYGDSTVILLYKI